MRCAILLYLILVANITVAQKNIVKGRVFAIPIIGFNYSLGIGYERMISDKVSCQILYNNYGYDWTNTDGGAINTQGFVPELRYYFGGKDSFRKQMFIGVFTELLRASERPGYSGPTDIGFFNGAIARLINPGLLIGKNVSLGKSWHLDLYLGWKYKFISKTEKYVDNGSITYINTNEQRSGFRAGVNLAYVF
jgi:uncharacterized protein DUF3575